MTVDVKLLDWTDALQAPSVVGGKAYQLAQLSHYGLSPKKLLLRFQS